MLMISIFFYLIRKEKHQVMNLLQSPCTRQRQTYYIARFLVAKMQAQDNGNIHAWKIKKKSHITVKFCYLKLG